MFTDPRTGFGALDAEHLQKLVGRLRDEVC